MTSFLMGLVAIVGGVLTGAVGFILVAAVVALLILPYVGFYRRSHRLHPERRLPETRRRLGES